MASINYRSTVVALTKETTEGTPVLPSADTQYLPILDDFAIEPDFDTQESAELKNSLGPSKPIQGLENPSASFGLYLKASGTSGTAPNYGPLLEAAFGEVDDAGVEHDTVASSTVSLIKVDTGEGASYQKGQPLLVQDGTNGYSIRPVYSISGNDLTPAFNLANAPAAGVNLGEAVTYRPTNSGHPTLSLWQYLGNGGATQALCGGRVTELSIEFATGELIAASYNVEGVKYFFNPIEITSSTNKMDFDIGASELNVSVTAKVYRDPHELAAALETAMDGASADEITVTYSDSTGKFTIASAGSELNLLWSTGANTAQTIGTKLGFSVGVDDTGSLSYVADSALSFAAPQSPSYDNADPLVAKNNEVLIGDATDNTAFEASNVSFTLSLEKTDILSVCAESGKSGSIINARSATVSVTALLNKYDVSKFKRYRENTETRFMYAFGEKSGGNWVKGKCGCLYSPTMVISSLTFTDQDGLVAMEMELSTYVNSSGDGEIFLGFV